MITDQPLAQCESSQIQALRQEAHQLEWAPAVNHLVDQVALTAWQHFHTAFRRRPDSGVGSMYTRSKQQRECGISKCHEVAYRK